MAIMDEVGLTAAREMRKNLRSTKGLAMFALFVLGGVGASSIYLKVTQALLEKASEVTGGQLTDDALRESKLGALRSSFPDDTANYLVNCPAVLLWLFKSTLWALPLLILMMGFDSIAGETQHRGLRYVAPRAHRASIVVGKALGLWAIASLMIAVLHVSVWGVLLANGSEQLGDILSWGSRFWLFASFYAASYVGLTILLSSIFRLPVVALFAGTGLVFLMGLVSLIFGQIERLQPLQHLFPSHYDTWLLSHDPLRVVSGIAVLLAWGATCITITSEIVRRRDL